MKTTELRQLIQESIQEYIREVETSGNIAAQEAKIRACEEAIAIREKKINLEGLDETMHEMIDKSKLNELKKEVKELQKYKTKAENLLEKMKNRAEGKTTKKMKDESVEEEAVIDEVNIDETFPESGAQLEELDEAKKKPSAGMTKKEKSAVAKKAHAGKDIGKKGKGFEKVAKAGEKQYGSKEAGQKVAAAAMWKAATKHESVNESFLRMQKLAGLLTEAEYQKKFRYFIVIIFEGDDDELGSMKGISASNKEEFDQKLKAIYGDNGLAAIKKHPEDTYWTFYEVNNENEMNNLENMSEQWYTTSDPKIEQKLESIAKRGKPYSEIKIGRAHV